MAETPDTTQVKKELNSSRFRMGFAQLFFSGEESTLNGLKVLVIKSLGGHDMHLAFIGSFSGLVSFTQWLSVPLLRYFRSNRKAMAAALSVGVAGGLLLALTVLGGASGKMLSFFLWTFLTGVLLMSIATGIQNSVETNWIGDLVPQNCRGWFYSVKGVISLIGMSSLAALFGYIVDNFGNLTLSGTGIFLVVGLSHVLAIMLIWKIPDREPQIKPLFEKGKLTGINLKSPALWLYIAFYMLWTGGRTLFSAFVTVFLITEFKLSLVQLSGFLAMSQIVSCIMVLVLGRISDKRGNRKLLMLLSLIVALGMFCYQLTPFLGLVPVIVTYIINSMGGMTHTMLVVNYSLEIIPAVGRATYNSFIRVLMGAWTLLVVNLGGLCAHLLERHQFTFELFGKTYSRYHVMFGIGALMAACCVIPLLLVGSRKIEDANE